MRRPLALTAAALAVAGAVVVGLGWAALRLPGPGTGPVTVTIEEGARFSAVARHLHDRGLLWHPLPLIVWSRLTGEDRTIGWGEYTIERPITPLALLARLSGTPDLHRVTVPEGLTVRETIALLAEEGFGTEQELLAVVTSPSFLEENGLPAKGAEGYLFPDTYAFTRNASGERILRTLVERFHEQFDEELIAKGRALGLTPNQVVTLASLIEEETGHTGERRLVSAVFHNRLRRGMRLQSDPTAIYGRAGSDRRITRRDLERPTRHNTYVIPALPPTPISNPGRASLEAAVDPAPADYLYFVARGDGSHKFTSNLRAHNDAVARLRRRQRR